MELRRSLLCEVLGVCLLGQNVVKTEAIALCQKSRGDRPMSNLILNLSRVDEL